MIAAANGDANNINKKAILQNCVTFTNFISEINNTQIDHAKDFDTVMPLYNLIEYSNNYSKTFGKLWQYCKDIPAVNNNGNIVEFDDSIVEFWWFFDDDSLIFKAKITGQTDGNRGIDNVEIMVTLKYLSNFWRTLEMPLIVKLILFWLGLQFLISFILILKIKILHFK